MNDHVTQDPEHPHHGIAKFNLFGKIVYHVGTADVATIRAIALNKDLSFSQGNNFLFAGIQGAGQKGTNDDGEMDAEERKEMRNLAKAISPARLTALTPVFAVDAVQAFQEWFAKAPRSAKDPEHSRLIDLQYTYYHLVFKFTVRMMGVAEYASSPADLNKLIWAFWLTQRNAGFWTTLTPWLPQPQLLKRIVGAITLWTMVRATVDKRIKQGRREDDYAQTLIDQETAPGTVSRFVLGGLIAGILNTIGTGAYTLAWIGADPELQDKVRREIEQVCRKSAQNRGDNYEDLTFEERLKGVKLEEWEAGCQTLMLCFRESIRFLLTNSINRYYPGPLREKGKDGRAQRLKLMGHEIEDDCYVVYSPSSNLHDASKFAEPWKFDPYRYTKAEEQTEYDFVGWGFGHHSKYRDRRVEGRANHALECTGIRFAKLETVMATATFILTHRFVTVNDKDVPYKPQEVPLSDLSQLHWRAPRKPMRLRITKISPDI